MKTSLKNLVLALRATVIGQVFVFELYSDLRCALHLRYRIEQTGNGCIADLLVLV